MTGDCIFNIIIGKLSYRKKLSLIILLIINKSPMINLYSIILFFDLAINLKIEGGKKPSLNPQVVI